MKRNDFLIAICLLVISGTLIAKYGFWRPHSEVIVESSPKVTDDQEQKARVALLKKYSKGAPSYVAPDANLGGQADQTDTQTDIPGQPFDAAPAPSNTNPSPQSSTTTAPRVLAPNVDQTDPNTDDTTGQAQAYPRATPPVPYDDYTRALAASQLADPWNASDQQLLDGMMGMLDDDQRNTFQNMWSSLTPDEQEQWLYELRGMLSP
jgi:hypothetical protein